MAINISSNERQGKKRGRKAKVEHTPGVFLRKFRKKKSDGSYYEYQGEIYQICYCAPDPKTGKAKNFFESSHSKVKSVAEKLLKDRQVDVLKQKNPHAVSKSDLTVREFVIKHYLIDKETLKMEGLKEHKQVLGEICGGLDTEKDVNRKIHNPKMIGRYKLSMLDAPKVQKYLDEKEDRGNAQSTLNRHISAIKKVIKIAFEKGFAPHHVLVEMKKIKKGAENNSKINYLRLPQVKILLDECEAKSQQLRQFVEFAMGTGIRKNRIYKLEWSMVDIENRQIRIPKDKHHDRFNSSLGDTAIKVLKERMEVRNEDIPFIFYNPRSKDRWYDLSESFERAVNRALKEAIKLKLDTNGLSTFVFHDLRHTFISHLVMSGVPIAHVKDLAGHKTLAMTMRYSHLDPNTLKAGLAKLPY